MSSPGGGRGIFQQLIHSLLIDQSKIMTDPEKLAISEQFCADLAVERDDFLREEAQWNCDSPSMPG